MFLCMKVSIQQQLTLFDWKGVLTYPNLMFVVVLSQFERIENQVWIALEFVSVQVVYHSD